MAATVGLDADININDVKKLSVVTFCCITVGCAKETQMLILYQK